MADDIRAAVREIFRRRLGDRDRLDSGKLSAIGGDEVEVCRLIARDILNRFPHLSPPWTVADVNGDCTLDSLCDAIDRRTV